MISFSYGCSYSPLMILCISVIISSYVSFQFQNFLLEIFCVCLEFHFVQTSRCGFLHDYCEKLEHPTTSQIVVLKSHCLVNLTSDLFRLLCFHRLSHTLWLDVPFSVLNYTFEFYNAFTCFLWKSYCLLYPELVDFNKNGNLTLCWASTWGVNTNFS